MNNRISRRKTTYKKRTQEFILGNPIGEKPSNLRIKMINPENRVQEEREKEENLSNRKPQKKHCFSCWSELLLH